MGGSNAWRLGMKSLLTPRTRTLRASTVGLDSLTPLWLVISPLSTCSTKTLSSGDIVNKSEEHIWKHINGKRFLNMLEKKEAEKEMPNGIAEQDAQPPEKISQPKADSTKKKKKKKKPEEDVTEVICEVKNSSDKVNGTEEVDFWMPPVGERWDFDDGGDRWASDSESGSETEDANGADAATEEGKDDAMEISKRTKRMSIEIGPSNYASRKKKNKTKST
ncbi:hypothetical protein ACSBR1_023138 [Camellia fascicularis]